jgi:hypothetical protein
VKEPGVRTPGSFTLDRELPSAVTSWRGPLGEHVRCRDVARQSTRRTWRDARYRSAPIRPVGRSREANASLSMYSVGADVVAVMTGAKAP